MEDLEDFVMRRMPTAKRPLLMLTVLVVEDSRYACEAIRLMCLRSGARIRRADSLRAAGKHLRMYRPSVAIVDLGLPDGDGTALIRELAEANPRVSVILATSGDPDGAERAMAAGADGFLGKPVESLATFQEAILAHLPREVQPKGPRIVPDETFEPDPIALRDDLCHIQKIIEGRVDGSNLDYVAQFLGMLAVSAGDQGLRRVSEDLLETMAKGGSIELAIDAVRDVIAGRLAREELV